MFDLRGISCIHSNPSLIAPNVFRDQKKGLPKYVESFLDCDILKLEKKTYVQLTFSPIANLCDSSKGLKPVKPSKRKNKGEEHKEEQNKGTNESKTMVVT